MRDSLGVVCFMEDTEKAYPMVLSAMRAAWLGAIVLA